MEQRSKTVYTAADLTREARRAVKGKGRYVSWRLEIGEPLNGSTVVLVVRYESASDLRSEPVESYLYVAV